MEFLTNAFLTNFVVANNVIWNSSNWVGGIPSFKSIPPGGPAGGIYGEQKYLLTDYNNISGKDVGKNAKLFHYGDVVGGWATAELMSAGTMWRSNTSVEPVFVDPENYDFRPAAGDTALRNAGTNLTALMAKWGLPGLNVDLYGHVRGADGKWDKGMAEYTASSSVTNGLLVALNFDEDFSNGRIRDGSGAGRHAWRFGRPGYPTNWPSRASSQRSPAGPTSRVMPERLNGGDGWSLYGKSGRCGITNGMAAFTNMTEGTIMCWANTKLRSQPWFRLEH
jgi:hypothetical protein